jgi:hypothetical protein
MSEDYIQDNTSERQRLISLVAKLTDAELVKPLPNGWTVATKLLHLAFWDQYCLALLKSWKEGVPSAASIDVDAVNAAARALSVAVPAGKISGLVREAAEAVDREVENIGPELKAAIESAGRGRVLRRYVHRRAHLDQIGKVLRV